MEKRIFITTDDGLKYKNNEEVEIINDVLCDGEDMVKIKFNDGITIDCYKDELYYNCEL